MSNKTLTDISQSRVSYPTTLSAVGMEAVELLINGNAGLAKIFVQFNDKNSRGIHMSRLYKLLRDTFSSNAVLKNDKNNLSAKNLKSFLKEVLESHKGQTNIVYLSLEFPLTIKRNSLVSKEWGFRTYPIKIKASLTTENIFQVYIDFELTYSSTCPCSASLAQDLNKEALLTQLKGKKNIEIKDIENWFSDLQNVAAFPHAQRSKANITLLVDHTLQGENTIDFINVQINKAEKVLQTVVQAFVKREDEQAFASLNAKNLLFCEDSARKLKILLTNTQSIEDFFIKVTHEESLHPHNAVSFSFKEDGNFFKAKEFLILS